MYCVAPPYPTLKETHVLALMMSHSGHGSAMSTRGQEDTWVSSLILPLQPHLCIQ